MTNVATTSKHLPEEKASDILNESDMFLISDISEDSGECGEDIAVAAAINEEESEVKEEGQGHSLDDTDCNSVFGWGRKRIFSRDSGAQNSSVMFKIDKFLKIVVKTNN
jgi:hypothetical protein